MYGAPDGSSPVCRKDGIIEPVTFSLLRFLEDQAHSADGWIDDTCDEGSAALLNRVTRALAQLVELNPEGRIGNCARRRLDEKVSPALSQALRRDPSAATS